MPSTTSSSVSAVFPSSTVITPSLPTLPMASAIIFPIEASPLAEIVPTCAISEDLVILVAFFNKSPAISPAALSIPRFRSIGFMPAATRLSPSRTMACANTVAVVVPSPALSLVLDATSRSIIAPKFW